MALCFGEEVGKRDGGGDTSTRGLVAVRLSRDLAEEGDDRFWLFLFEPPVRLDEKGGHDRREQARLCHKSEYVIWEDQEHESHKYEKGIDVLFTVPNLVAVHIPKGLRHRSPPDGRTGDNIPHVRLRTPHQRDYQTGSKGHTYLRRITFHIN